METQAHNLSTLFEQLGLPSDGASIDAFIDDHQLAPEVKVSEAPFWKDTQATFLKESIQQDGPEAIWVDELNERLHKPQT